MGILKSRADKRSAIRRDEDKTKYRLVNWVLPVADGAALIRLTAF
jgi:hypothetical protein